VTVDAWLLFCVTEAVLCLTPGPAVLLVVSLTLSRGGRAGLAGALGVLAANGLYFALSGTSLGVILRASWRLFTVVKWAGAAYLVWLGLRMILAPREECDDPGARRAPTARSFRDGFLTQAANPKALVFFTAILPQFIDPRGAVGLQILVLGVSSVVIELVVLAGYVVASRTARAWARGSPMATPLRRAGGVLLVGAGVQLAAIRRG
jgi:threonine/homoserine/homoserine lactone efflux protein